MGSPAQFGHLVNFAAALRKPGLIPFGTFTPQDSNWLSVITDLPSSVPSSATYSRATIPFSSTLVINANAAQVQYINLVGNITSLTIDGSPVPGQWMILEFIQDSIGGWTVPLGGLVHDATFAIDPTANTATKVPIMWTGTQWQLIGMAFSSPAP